MTPVLVYGADQRKVGVYTDCEIISDKRCRLYSLTVTNKGATDFYVQIYDMYLANPVAANWSVAADPYTPQFEYIVQAGMYTPFSAEGGWLFQNGCFVRCVTALDGAHANLIVANDAKITAGYMDVKV